MEERGQEPQPNDDLAGACSGEQCGRDSTDGSRAIVTVTPGSDAHVGEEEAAKIRHGKAEGGGRGGGAGGEGGDSETRAECAGGGSGGGEGDEEREGKSCDTIDVHKCEAGALLASAEGSNALLHACRQQRMQVCLSACPGLSVCPCVCLRERP